MAEPTTLNPEPITIEGQVEGFVPQLEHLLEQGQAHEHALREAANEQRRENGRIQRLLTVLGKDSAPPKTRKKPSYTMSQNRLDSMMAYFHKHKDRPHPPNVSEDQVKGPGEVTSIEIGKHFKWASGQVSQGLRILRDQDQIRKVASVTVGSGKNSARTNTYTLMEGDNG